MALRQRSATAEMAAELDATKVVECWNSFALSSQKVFAFECAFVETQIFVVEEFAAVVDGAIVDNSELVADVAATAVDMLFVAARSVDWFFDFAVAVGFAQIKPVGLFASVFVRNSVAVQN